MTDVLVIGAGPAGISAALQLATFGCHVTVVDDQPAPGGRIFAAIETRSAYNAEDRTGAALVAEFRAAGGTYLSSAEVWQIETGPRVFLSQGGAARMIEPQFVLMATGAQERPMPFVGWQLPGVMTVGGAQLLLKVARQIPDEPVWLAGTGPLLLLYANQLAAAGGQIAGILDTTPKVSPIRAARALPAAFQYGWRDLLRGLRWRWTARHTRTISDVVSIEGVGDERLERVRYTTSSGTAGEVETHLLFIHDGVVPSVHGTLAAGCEHHWNRQQRCFEPVVDGYGRSSQPGIFVAGDGGTIAGARAAALSGRLAAIGIALAGNRITPEAADEAAKPIRASLRAAGRFRRFLDGLFPPAELVIADKTMVCRCEEVSAGTLRAALAGRAQLGADGVKIATRAGMGPCQGRQCGLSITRLIAEVHGGARDVVELPRIRPPLKPLTLKELATLEDAD